MKTKRSKPGRRAFLGMGLAAAAAGGVTTACSRRAGAGGRAWRFFTGEEARTVEAICARFIPSDDAPGAKEAGVLNYIDIQLTKAFKRHQETYRKGIAAIDAASRSAHQKSFAALAEDEQDEILAEAEEKQPAFFNLVLDHTMQGFYGDPRHGGNRGMVSWKMLGLPFPPVRGRMHYPAAEGKRT